MNTMHPLTRIPSGDGGFNAAMFHALGQGTGEDPELSQRECLLIARSHGYALRWETREVVEDSAVKKFSLAATVALAEAEVVDGFGLILASAFENEDGEAVLIWAESIDRPTSPRGWQPIATAPKDGSHVLVCTPNGRVTIAHWDNDQYTRNSRPFWNLREHSRRTTESRANQPLFWMPLPPAPKAATICPACNGTGWQSILLPNTMPDHVECETCGNPENQPRPAVTP